MRTIVMLGFWAGWTTAVSAAPVPKVDERKQQEEAVKRIEELGGKVWYDYETKYDEAHEAHLLDSLAEPADPAAFHRVVFVNFFGNDRVADDDLKCLASLPALEGVSLARTKVTNRGLAHLAGLKKLTNLNLQETAVGNDGLKHLQGATGLRKLGLWKVAINDDGLKHLAGLKNLRSLTLDETRITDAGLVHLKDMTELSEWFGLAGTGVTDEGLQHLKGFTKLKQLVLRNTAVTADGVKGLQKSLPKTEIAVGR